MVILSCGANGLPSDIFKGRRTWSILSLKMMDLVKATFQTEVLAGVAGRRRLRSLRGGGSGAVRRRKPRQGRARAGVCRFVREGKFDRSRAMPGSALARGRRFSWRDGATPGRRGRVVLHPLRRSPRRCRRARRRRQRGARWPPVGGTPPPSVATIFPSFTRNFDFSTGSLSWSRRVSRTGSHREGRSHAHRGVVNRRHPCRDFHHAQVSVLCRGDAGDVGDLDDALLVHEIIPQKSHALDFRPSHHVAFRAVFPRRHHWPPLVLPVPERDEAVQRGKKSLVGASWCSARTSLPVES